MLVVIYNDAAYGAEVHHFRPHGHPAARAVPDTDFAALAVAAGAHGVTVRRRGPRRDRAVAGRARRPARRRCKSSPDFCAEWLEEAFK